MKNDSIRLDTSGDPGFFVSYEHVLRSDMTMKAKGLYIVLCALADKNRSVTRKQILNTSQDGIRSYNSTMKELRKNGYVSRDFYRDEKGKILSSEIVFHKNAHIEDQKPQTLVKSTLDSESPKTSLSDFPHPTPREKPRLQWNQENIPLEYPPNSTSDQVFKRSKATNPP